MKRSAFLRLVLAPTVLSGVPCVAHAQNPASVLAQAYAAFSQSKPVNSITLDATAQWTADVDAEAGNATLTANADGSYSVQLQLGQTSRIEAQTSFASGQSCTWAGADGVAHAVAAHNCMGSMAWFLPQVALFGSQQPGALATSIQSATLGDGSTVLDVGQQITAAAALITHLSSMDLYLDPTTYLPNGLAFNIHPDRNAAADIPVQVIFGNYQTVNGVSIPFRIQRYVNGSLQLDLTVTQASAN